MKKRSPPRKTPKTSYSHEDIIDAEIEPIEPSEDSDSSEALETRESEEGDLDPELVTGGALVPEVEPSDALVPGGDGALVPATTGVDSLKKYIQEISKYALLTPEEELKLALDLRDRGDMDAARRLVTANLRLVVKIAMEYRAAHSNVLDLIQEGNIGLMKAVSKYDPTKWAKLSYYASWWIRSYILKYILDNFRLVKVGTTQAQKKLFYQLMREKERLEAQGLDSGPKLLADRLQVKEKDVIEMNQRLSSSGAEVSLQAPVGPSGGEDRQITQQDRLVDPTEGQDERLALHELIEELRRQLPDFEKTLGAKEKVLFTERLMAESPKTLQEVADLFGMTRERARQIESKVIEKLRDFFNERVR